MTSSSSFAPGPGMAPAATARPEDSLRGLVAALHAARRHRRVHLLLDYDGTLVPIAAAPHLATPDPALLRLLTRLAAAPGLAVDIVSGRARDTLNGWFARLPMALWAEHAFWHRPRAQASWHAAIAVTAGWADAILPTLRALTADTPGSQLEVKSAALAWHFRNVPGEDGERRADQLRRWLAGVDAARPLDVVDGKKVVEVRLLGVSKALAAREALDGGGDPFVVAIGDDRTDEDLFRALPAQCPTIAVGQPLAGARYQLDGPHQVRQLLEALLPVSSAP